MHVTTTIPEPGVIAGSLQHPASVHDHSAQVYDDPAQVLRDNALGTAEKRAILSSWASDANAIEQQPWLRSLPGSGRTVPLAAILAALRRLDDDDPPPKGGAAIRLCGFGRDSESFEQIQPLGRRHHGLAQFSKHVRSRALPRLRRDHAARTRRAAAGRAACL
ncbi:conserved hypothetical protein [Rhodopseudomonas palustris HaA2]|uniref:Uncharacterized protein n=1 Tax=Rhodopseudomonas palustris (strain HaA2) TaxID=316058 RepID=Q2IWA7_RHOP2|nr:hypothetical protein [Rhodopseudomonas palustris]ABD07503.1 conserved hypothetical protein [Rhodopseudomonas palustris HaA2]